MVSPTVVLMVRPKHFLSLPGRHRVAPVVPAHTCHFTRASSTLLFGVWGEVSTPLFFNNK